MILTNKAIHCQNKREHPWRINLDDIENIEFKERHWAPRIYINDKKIDCTALDKDSKKFMVFLEKCINYIKDIKNN